MNKRAWLCLGMLVVVFISGCGRQNSLIIDTAKSAIIGQPDVIISAQQIAKIPYASAYLKVGDAPRAFVVLGLAEDQQLKWFTADHNMVATHNGRISKTVGFDCDLLYSSDAAHDPLGKGLLNLQTSYHWQHREVWSTRHRSGYTLQSTFINQGPDTLTILDKARSLLRVDEQVYIPALNMHYTNSFWLDPETGAVVQSHQHLGPDLPLIQFTILKPYAS